MAVGRVSTRILTDIANAIRQRNGTARVYRSSEMAAAVSALDGTSAGAPAVRGYMELEGGLVSDKALAAIGDAIRAHNGSDERYAPGDMAAAILALLFDRELKVRTLLLDGGVLEFNYLAGRRSASGGQVVAAFDVDAGYASADARPWKGVRGEVTAVVLDASLAAAGVESCAYWFAGFSRLMAVTGFENLGGVRDVTQAFSSCGELRSVYVTGFDASAVTASESALYGCAKLVGGADGATAPSGAGASVLHVGAGGVLTDPTADSRTWLEAALFDDGELRIGVAAPDAADREVVAAGTVCANARYAAVKATPWASAAKRVARVAFEGDVSGLSCVNLNYWFYGCTALESVSGMGNLRGVARMAHAFNSCTALAELDLRGMGAGALEDLAYAFGGCAALERILVDADWELPEGCSGASAFYGCKALCGGNGTAYDAKATGFGMMRVDREGQPGYLTAG